jgi:hypothetical protein
LDRKKERNLVVDLRLIIALALAHENLRPGSSLAGSDSSNDQQGIDDSDTKVLQAPSNGKALAPLTGDPRALNILTSSYTPLNHTTPQVTFGHRDAVSAPETHSVGSAPRRIRERLVSQYF